jgi:hypothetical protein
MTLSRLESSALAPAVAITIAAHNNSFFMIGLNLQIDDAETVQPQFLRALELRQEPFSICQVETPLLVLCSKLEQLPGADPQNAA